MDNFGVYKKKRCTGGNYANTSHLRKKGEENI